MTRLLVLAAATAAATLATVPAAAQDAAGDRVNTVIVYGDDECPQSDGGDIVVCARLEESERFRIPEALRRSNDPENEAWANKVRAYETVGNFGALSCSPAGSGGELGCTAKMIEAAYRERETGSDVRAGELIAAARDERLSTIDAEAAATQARVEELERQYMARVEAEEAGQVAPRQTDPNVPVVVDPSQIRPAP
ncbi:MAG TPA: hypothetical protein VI168_04635 [Croceibacterium sp.]